MAGAPTASAPVAAVPSLPALGRGCWEDVSISLGLVGVQLGGAAYMVVVTPVLALGLDPLFLVAVGSLCTGILTLPFAVKIERYPFVQIIHRVVLFDQRILVCNNILVEQEEMAVWDEQPAASRVHRAGIGRVRSSSNQSNAFLVPAGI